MAKKDQKAAIAELIAAASPAADQQMELMPAMRPSLTDSQVERVETAIKAERRGRPPGAQNKATREMLEFVRKLCGDPLERRFRYAMHTPETLAIELGCSKLEAFDRLDRMWSELAIGPDGSTRAPWLYIEQRDENQALSVPADGVSHGNVSHDDD